MHLSDPDTVSSICGRLLLTTSYTGALELLGHTINFNDNWLQCFGYNYGKRTDLFKNMKELFQKIPLYITTRNSDDYKDKYHSTIK